MRCCLRSTLRGSHARSNEQHLVADDGAQCGEFVRGGGDSIHPSFLGQSCELLHSRRERTCQPDPGDFGVIEASENCNSKQLWRILYARQGLPRRAQHIEAARRVDGQQTYFGQLGCGSDGLRDSIGDVAELQIEEYSRDQRCEFLDGGGPSRGEQLVPDLDQGKSSFEFLNNADGLWQAAKVQGDDQLTGCFAFDVGTSSNSSLTCASPR